MLITLKYFPGNCRYLREKRGLTPKAAGALVGVERSTWAGYESGLSKPNLEVFIKIVEEFDTTASDLIERDLNLPQDLKAISKELPGNVYDLDTKAAAGMPMLLNDTDKFRDLPTLYIPYLGPGIHIRSQISGDSMHGTIKDGDHVIATFVSEPSSDIREGHIYLILDKDDGLVCKRIYKKGRTHLELESDNTIYPPYQRHVNDILGVFKVQEVHTRDLRNYFTETRKEVSKLWAAIDAINRRLPG